MRSKPGQFISMRDMEYCSLKQKKSVVLSADCSKLYIYIYISIYLKFYVNKQEQL